jgi:hypothetical protein
MYALYPQTVEPFAQNVRKIIQEKNLEAWRKLYDIFAATSQRPRPEAPADFGRPPERLTMIQYQTNLPDLSAEEVPEWDSPSLRWLLRTFILLWDYPHLSGGWDKFAAWFMNNLSEELKAKGGAELEEHQFLMNLFFGATRAFPQSFQILQLNESALENFVSQQQLSTLIDVEDRVGLLRRLSYEYCRSSDGIIRGLGTEIGMIDNFLPLLRFRDSAVYYMQWAT